MIDKIKYSATNNAIILVRYRAMEKGGSYAKFSSLIMGLEYIEANLTNPISLEGHRHFSIYILISFTPDVHPCIWLLTQRIHDQTQLCSATYPDFALGLQATKPVFRALSQDCPGTQYLERRKSDDSNPKIRSV